MSIEQLATEMNMPLADVSAFVACLKVWMDKGYTLEEALERHMAQMRRMVNNAVRLASTTEGREIAVSAFFPNSPRREA